MSILIINWPDGENDPFSYFNRYLKNSFEEQGRLSRIINLGDQFIAELLDAQKDGIEFAITWQGLGSGIKTNQNQFTTIWDELQIPLLCYHGDHPCHMPPNHNASSAWVRHIYSVQSFARFANQYIPRKNDALYIETPLYFADTIKGRFAGDFFVLPKNIDDNATVFASWNNAPQRQVVEFLRTSANEIILEFLRGNHKNHHDIIDELLTQTEMGKMRTELGGASDLDIRFYLHALLDKIHRNMIAENILIVLDDIPIKIYGRGWNRYKTMGNPHHEFLDANTVSNGDFQFASNYGILDVASVNDSLHDRTGRAMANNAGFLMGSNWPHSSLLGEDFSDIFFSGTPGNLHSKAVRVMSSPELHRQRCHDFSLRYQSQFPMSEFLRHLDTIAASMSAQV